jgi:hypothetical protein
MKISRILRNFGMLIELGEIKHLSIYMKITGKVSSRVQKKWHKRMDRELDTYTKCKHRWLPATVLGKKYNLLGDMFWWQCSKCHNSCNYLYHYEIDGPLATEYSEHIREY